MPQFMTMAWNTGSSSWDQDYMARAVVQVYQFRRIPPGSGHGGVDLGQVKNGDMLPPEDQEHSGEDEYSQDSS